MIEFCGRYGHAWLMASFEGGASSCGYANDRGARAGMLAVDAHEVSRAETGQRFVGGVGGLAAGCDGAMDFDLRERSLRIRRTGGGFAEDVVLAEAELGKVASSFPRGLVLGIARSNRVGRGWFGGLSSNSENRVRPAERHRNRLSPCRVACAAREEPARSFFDASTAFNRIVMIRIYGAHRLGIHSPAIRVATIAAASRIG